uniref:Uncharacterized protein n=1 Tax=Cacopsylla melanoneura TaxID=428564 RepID=A0A8D8M4T6_9HEMI
MCFLMFQAGRAPSSNSRSILVSLTATSTADFLVLNDLAGVVTLVLPAFPLFRPTRVGGPLLELSSSSPSLSLSSLLDSPSELLSSSFSFSSLAFFTISLSFFPISLSFFTISISFFSIGTGLLSSTPAVFISATVFVTVSSFFVSFVLIKTCPGSKDLFGVITFLLGSLPLVFTEETSFISTS